MIRTRFTDNLLSDRVYPSFTAYRVGAGVGVVGMREVELLHLSVDRL